MPSTPAADAPWAPGDKWIKLSRGEVAYGGYKLRRGLNVDHLPFDPRPRVAGGLHMCRLRHAAYWIRSLNATTVWDVQIPDGDGFVELGNHAKAPALVLSNPRAIEACPDLTGAMLHMVNKRPNDIENWPLRMRTAAIAEAVVARNPYCLSHFAESQRTPAVCAIAISNASNGYDISWIFTLIPVQHRTAAMCDRLFVWSPHALCDIPVALRTLERCVAGVRADPECMMWVPLTLRGAVAARLAPQQVLRRSSRIASARHRQRRGTAPLNLAGGPYFPSLSPPLM